MIERKFNFFSNKKEYITTPLRKLFSIYFFFQFSNAFINLF